MPVRFSFVIPTLNEQSNIAALLQSLRQYYPQGELIVVDGGSSDKTVAQALPHCDQLMIGRAGRAVQMNLGAQVATSQYLFFLHADTQPEISVETLQLALKEQPQWGFSPVRLSGSRLAFRVIEWFINQRSRLTQVATGDQMLFVQRDFFLQQGGFEVIELMEDVALSKRLRNASPPVILAQPVVTSSRRWEEGGVVRTIVRMWLLRFAYMCGTPPGTLWRYYYGR